MQLENVTAEIRPRGRWESIDLGCALVRENYGKIMTSWFGVVIPLWLVILALSQFWPYPEGRPWVGWLACWLVLPLCDRVPLFILSRTLFGGESKLSEVYRALPGMWTRRFFYVLIVGRFSFNRGLAQPISELEGLKGKMYKDRVNLLSRNGGEGATQACLVSWVLVLATMFSLMFIYLGVIDSLGDSVVLENFWVEHVLGSEADFIPVPYVWVMAGLHLIALTLIEPFFVGAGFAMYINSRTVTEGWDIELAFKRMNQRIRDVVSKSAQSSLLLLLTLSTSFAFLGQVKADENPRLDEVMAAEEFTIHTEEIRSRVNESDVESDGGGLESGSIFNHLGGFFFWLIVTVSTVLVVWMIVKNSYVFKGRKVSGVVDDTPKLRSVMGMDVAPESLPDDIVAAASKAWQQGKQHEAMSLLYRGAISFSVNNLNIDIVESDTEQDCVERLRLSGDASVVDYFSTLTEQWVTLAYGFIKPVDADFHALCMQWPFKQHGSRGGGRNA